MNVGYDNQWNPEDREGASDVCTLFEAAARLPRLRTLFARAPLIQVHHGSLARLVGARLGAVEELEVEFLDFRLHDVALLAPLRGLRRLHVWGLDLARPDEWARLVAQHASQWLQNDKDCHCNGAFSHSPAISRAGGPTVFDCVCVVAFGGRHYV